MNDDRAHDLAAQASGGLVTVLPDYDDTQIAWYPPLPPLEHQANTFIFATAAGEFLPFTWGVAIIGVDDIPHATIAVYARGDVAPRAADVELHVTGEQRSAPLGDVERLIERYNAFAQRRETGGPFPPRDGRRPGQKTALTPEQAEEITRYVQDRRAVNDRWDNIIAELKQRYPEDLYEHKWNRRTLGRWVNPGHKRDTNRRPR